jgi:hypothetical protein
LVFAAGTVVLAGLVAVWLWFGPGRPRLALACLAFGALLVVLAALHPPSILALRAGWLSIARVVGLVNTTIILTLIYCVFVVPIALVQRLLRRDPLARRGSPRFVTRPQARDRTHFERPY